MWRERIVGPALAADFVVEMRVAVGADVEPGDFLRVQIDRDRVDVLLAEAGVDHRVEEAARAQIAVYQLGRGSEPMIEVGSMMSLVARSISRSPPGTICRWP